MVDTASSEDFGKDLGLCHEMIITGRKVGADRAFFAALAEHEELFREVVECVKARLESSVWRIWRTMELGTGLTPLDFRGALKSNGFFFNSRANDLFNNTSFTVAKRKIEVDLVAPSVFELGFPKGSTRENIYRRAQELGLKLCPLEVIPQLRLAYREQPKEEKLHVAAELITGEYSENIVFCVSRYADNLWLGDVKCYPGEYCPARSRWVFVRPRTSRSG